MYNTRHTADTTHSAHTGPSGQPRVKVTFSDHTADEHNGGGTRSTTPPVSLQHKILQTVELKFQTLRAEYAADTLTQIITDVLKAQHVVKCRTAIFTLGTGGVWTQSAPSTVLKLVLDVLLKRSHDQCQRLRNKIEHVLQLSNCGPSVRANVLQTLEANQEDLRTTLIATISNRHLMAALRSVRNDLFVSDMDRDRDVVAACDQLYRVSPSGPGQRAITKVTSRDEMAKFRVTKQLPFPLPVVAALSSTLMPTVLQGIDTALVSALQTLLGNALFANRLALNTIIHIVGEGAAAFGSEVLSVAGDLAFSACARGLTSTGSASTLQGRRLLLMSTDDGTSIAMISRAIQKLQTKLRTIGDWAAVLPIVISSTDQTPLTLASSWKVLLVPLTPLPPSFDRVPALPAAAGAATDRWYQWLIHGLSSGTAHLARVEMTAQSKSAAPSGPAAPTGGPTTTRTPSQPLVTSSQELTNVALLAVIDDFVTENGWSPTPSGTTFPQRTVISSVLPAVRAAASKRGMHSVQITQALAAQLLERRKFKVKNHSNRLVVEWHRYGSVNGDIL